MITRNKLFIIFSFFILALVGCGGSTTGGGDDAPVVVDPGTDPTVPTQRVIRFGSFDGTGSFNQGQISASQIGLQAGESASLSVALLDQNGAAVNDVTDIFFSSSCISMGLAEVTDSSGMNAQVTPNNNGSATVTYTARGCEASDTVTARTGIDGNDLIARVTLQTEQGPIGSLLFESVDRDIIGIQGSGQIPEQATLVFRVTNNVGGPVANQQVEFTLNTTVGGITLSNTAGITGADGRVSTTVTSGTVATTVRVTADAMRDGQEITGQSSGLTITTGFPDNDSVSVTATDLNFEGLSFDGETTQINVRSADRFNNPVPDGTAFNFTTEGGSIVGNCNTVNGVCSVTLTSQDPRPANGRATILVSGTGEENFVDINGNGRFDDGELTQDTGNCDVGVPDEDDDLCEAFRDDNRDGVRQNAEPFIDFDEDTTFDMANGRFDGLLCIGPNNCGNNSITVRELIEITFSGSDFDGPVDVSCDDDSINDNSPSRGCIEINDGNNITLSSPMTITVNIGDANGNPPPSGTTVMASTTVGEIVSQDQITQASIGRGGAIEYNFRVEPVDDDAGDSGTFSIVVTTPNGLISSQQVDISQPAPPAPPAPAGGT